MPHHHGSGSAFHRGKDDDDDCDDIDAAAADDDDNNDDDGKMLLLLDRGVVATMAAPTSPSLNQQRPNDGNKNINDDGYYSDYQHPYPTCDVSTSHIEMGCIVLPIQMNLSPPHIIGNEVNYYSPPSYSIGKTSRVSLVAAYPPPFPVTSNPNHITTSVDEYDYDEEDNTALLQPKHLLQRYSGWYGTTSVHSATTAATTTLPKDAPSMLPPSPNGSLGYAESKISLNYRCPSFVVVPSLLSLVSYSHMIHNYEMRNNEKAEQQSLHQHHHQQVRRNRSRRRRHHLITDLHCTMHLGPSTTSSAVNNKDNNNNSVLSSIGTTFSTPDGRSQLRLDSSSNAWLQWGRKSTNAMRAGDTRNKYYLVCASHDFFLRRQHDGLLQSSSPYHCRLFPPVRAQCAMRLIPCQAALRSQNFLLTISTKRNKDSLATSSTTNTHERGYEHSSIRRYDGTRFRNGRPRPDVTLCLGYGAPPSSFILSGEMLLNGANNIACGDSISMPNDYYVCAPVNTMEGRDAAVVIPSSFVYSSGNLKLTVEQHLPSSLQSSSSSSSSSMLHGTIEYLHAGRVLTFGTMLTRSFATSKFSRLGVGVRQSFFGNLLRENIDNNRHGGSVKYPWRWWCRRWAEAGGGCITTSWLFQLERGGVRLLVPVTLGGGSTVMVSSWRTSFLGLFYASLASIIVDVIVCELLCGVTSRLRIGILRFLLGEECVCRNDDDDDDDDDDGGDHDEHWLDEQCSMAKEDALRQVNLMVRQARATTKNEEEMNGLVIVKAVYGVMDNKHRRWLSRRRNRRVVMEDAADIDQHESISTEEYYAMDATTQLQFWVAKSTLRLPELSKRHLLGFYDVLADVGDDGCVAIEENERENKVGHGNTFTRILDRLWWKGAPTRPVSDSKKQRDLSVRLSIRYKFEGRVYDVMFDDNQAVELPSRLAEEVRLPRRKNHAEQQH